MKVEYRTGGIQLFQRIALDKQVPLDLSTMSL